MGGDPAGQMGGDPVVPPGGDAADQRSESSGSKTGHEECAFFVYSA